MRKLKRQTGFGLLELMLSMVIVALLLIMATRYYQSARSNARVNEGVSLIASVVNAANNIAIGTGDYSTVNNTSIASYLPSNAQGGKAGELNDPWGGALTVDGKTDPKTLSIKMEGVGDDCQKLQDALGAGGQAGSYSKYTCSSGAFTAIETLAANPAT